MENNHDIDKKFNEASQSLEEPTTFPGFDKVWAKVEEKLDQKEEKKRIVPIWFPYGIAASLIIGLGALYFINKKEVADISKPQIVENKASEKLKTNVQAIDSTIKSNIKKEIDIPKIKNDVEVLAYENVKIPIVDGINNVDFEPVLETQPVYQPTHNLQWKDTLKQTNIKEVVVTGALGIKRRAYSYTSNAISVVSSENLEGKRSKRKQENGNALPLVASANYGNIDYMNTSGTTNIRNEFQQAKSQNLSQALMGKVSGLSIMPNHTTSGSANILIRGNNSLNKGNSPLVVINGVVADQNALSKLDPQQIKGVTILKDASATALYGSRAANGVVVVTTKKLSRKEKKAFEKLQKVQDSINRTRQIQQQNSEEYEAFVENPFELTKNQSVSTFSIDVDKAAYSNIRRMINNGEYINKNAVRIEEMINYFKYNYPQPKNNQPFSINTEYNDSPWNSKHKLLKIGLQGKDVPMDKLANSNFVFLIDVSGSMNAANKLPLLKSSFKVLLEQLRPQAKVGIVVYAGSAGMILPPTSAKEKNKILNALDNLHAGGSTAGGAGIELAYKLAQENFIKGGNNRVIIATDGDFNVGTSSTGDLQTLIEEKKKSGVFLTCLGFGMGNFKDNRMETLANKGNGNYAYIDNLQEANKFLGKEFAGSMYAIAKDVKIQIEFNPKYVKSYRLIGYENRKLKNEDFTNDKIDAGELGSGHTVTALYEVIPADVKSEFLPKESDLKYTKNTNDENFSDELATVKFRYKKPDGDTSSEIVQVVKNSNENLSSASDDFKFASSVAWFGLVLRNSDLIKNKDLIDVEKLGKKGRGNDDEGYRAEFVRLVEAYRNLNK
ncbi:Ca-activated chloride channel family protein [Chryseobacterium piscicola]|uniref:Ca-activated chloride channel family protein n=1 Tax=Chryseobacterium piscicola TaxID=551459 RepID=A0A1N7L7Y4_9FLAO|nr:VWA domain-containing protein [Chryseobacterium piscicola]PQA97424.1 VWA domain-containing protein [Chryseobacterium piscicola]SIS69891.1 Ca-activated chloride channel family protein [Chryseobacterium piscicola]